MRKDPLVQGLLVLTLLAGSIGLSNPPALAEKPCSKPSCMTYLDGLHMELARHPNNPEILMRLARAYQSEGDRTQTLRYLDLYLLQRPTDVGVITEAARMSLNIPDFAMGERYLKAALENGADPLPIHKELGIIYLKMDKPNQAIEEYQVILASDPDSVEGHANLGLAYLRMDNLKLAITELHRAAELDPTNGDRLNILGLAYIQAGRMNDAINSFKKALNVRPHSITYEYNLGEAYRLGGHEKEALTSFDNALHETPQTADEWFNQGKVHFRLGLYETCVKTYRTALMKYADPVSRAQVQLALGYAYEAMSMPMEARSAFESYLAVIPSGNTADNVRERVKMMPTENGTGEHVY